MKNSKERFDAMREAVDNPEKYPDLPQEVLEERRRLSKMLSTATAPTEKPSGTIGATEKKEETRWWKLHENRQDNDERTA